MAKTYNKMQIDMNGEINSSVTAVAQDTLSRYLDCYLFNNGVPIDLDGHMVQLYVNKPDKTTIVTQGEITDSANGRVQFELTNQTLAVPGWLEMQIVLLSGNVEVLSSHTFKLFVISSLRDDEAVESTNEFGALVVLFQDIQNALDLMKEMINTFGEPGEMAENYGVTTFWGMLEHLAAGADVEQMLKTNVNSTMGTSEFKPLNELLVDEIIIKHGAQTFTENGTFVVPKYIHKIFITACGGGGGGGGASSGGADNGGGGGGGGACILRKPFSVVPGQSIPITIGKGGTGGVSHNNPSYVTSGENGGTTVIGALISLPGGNGGRCCTSYTMNRGEGGDGAHGGGGGGGGTYAFSSGAGFMPGQPIVRNFASENLNYEAGVAANGGGGLAGGNGGRAFVDFSTGILVSGGGGGGSIGNGGDGGTSEFVSSGNTSLRSPTDGTKGGGGGGGICYSSNPYNGGAGGDGVVIIEW